MPDLAQQIRTELALAPWFGLPSNAIRAVLGLHCTNPHGECVACLELNPDGDWYRPLAPCPTVRAIATALGIEATDV